MQVTLLFLMAGDAALAVIAVSSAFMVRFGSFLGNEDLFSLMGGVRVSVFSLVLITTSFLMEFYSHEKLLKKREMLIKIAISLILSFFILSSIYYMMPIFMFGRGLLALALTIFGSLQFLWHIGCNKCLNLAGLASRVLVLGTGPLAKQIGGLITTTNNNHVLAGYYNCANETVFVPSHHVIGEGEGLDDTAIREKTHKIVVSLSERRGAFPLKEVLKCKFSGIQVVDAPSFYEQLTGKLLIENITPSWFIFSDGFRVTNFNGICKRLTDILFSVVGMVLAAPLLPIIVFLVKYDSPGPILFKQTRVGNREKNFVLYKFRSMNQDAESKTGAVWSQKDDPRVTKAGKFLRATRLDEIPQLYNVLKGDMSFVGPRPERPEFVAKLIEAIPFYSERHFAKPGLTGWAQVKYPYGSSVEDAIEKLRYDLYYIKNSSLFLDILIVMETVKVVLLGRGGR
ncbi:MAG: hypothetical protein FD174_189 [Geobacteraceae bacterium]|nr:MAG: hypothetical protein FD174_189 [Geobacteraceae bacterium]